MIMDPKSSTSSSSSSSDGHSSCGVKRSPPGGTRSCSTHSDMPRQHLSYEKLLSQSMTQMTVQDRETIMNDLHGVQQEEPQETKAWLDELLNQMDNSIQQRKQDKQGNSDEAYWMAEKSDRSYVIDRYRRCQFLRAEQYHPADAADRMMRHFALKRRLFGSDKLTSTIRLDDLEEDARRVIDNGAFQEAPVRDMAGRIIVLHFLALRSYQTPESALRAQWYFYMSIVERNMDVPLRGLIGIGYFVGTNGPAISGQLRYVLPFSFAAVHVCLSKEEDYPRSNSHDEKSGSNDPCRNSAGIEETVKVVILDAKPKFRPRFRIHVGSHMECQYALMSFGIPREALPISTDGVANLDHHREWVRRRIRIEANNTSTSHSTPTATTTAAALVRGEETPAAPPYSPGSDQLLTFMPFARAGITDNDILFGRRRDIVAHVGNERFRRLIDRHMVAYQAGGRQEKTVMADSVVRLMKERSVRFLKEDGGGGWVEVTHSEARKKTAHLFRNRKAYTFP